MDTYIIEKHFDEHGKFHRNHLEGPAKIWSCGSCEYIQHGERHRPCEIGPASVNSNGSYTFYEHGVCHRNHELGPAFFVINSIESYITHGKLHRPHELGPAVIFLDDPQGTYSIYYEHGIKKTLQEFKAIYKIQRWFRWQMFYNKHRELFEKVLGLPENHESILGKLYPNGGDLYKEIYQSMKILTLY
jgi:hypothetical protein